MACEVHDSADPSLWPALLELRRFLDSANALSAEAPCLSWTEGSWAFTREAPRRAPARGSYIVLPLRDEQEELMDPAAGLEVFSYRAFCNGREPFLSSSSDRDALGPARTLLRIYLPCLLGGFRARLNGQLFLLAHLAQTLDGRIACKNGHSKWISNEANLRHAHRLRALHDAVMVGARAVESDDPQLTVRHVTGRNPRRVVLNGSGSVLRASRAFQVCEGAGSLFVCQEDAPDLPALNGTNEIVRVAGVDRLFGTDEMARPLVERGLHSIFLEGGGRTVSHFIHAGAIDVLHLHIAPRILGSGINGFDLPEIMHIDEAPQMHMEHFSMDGELLFECRRTQPVPTMG